MKINTTLLILCLCLLHTRCIDEIAFNKYSPEQLLIVDGLITDSLQVHRIEISYSATIGSVSTDNITPPVIGASVKVYDDTGLSFDFTETQEGIYTCEMRGEVGKAYSVEIKTPDGRTILSNPSLLSQAPPLLGATSKVIDELTVSPNGTSITRQKLALEMNADISAMQERPFLRWRATGEYEIGEDLPGIIDRKICYVKHSVDFNNIRIFDTHELTGSMLTNEPFLQVNYDYRFAFMYCFHLYQYAISEEEYRYWQTVRDIVNIDGSIFDPPPGNVKGNLFNPDDPEERILGYFSVAGVSYGRYFTNAIEQGVTAYPLCSEWPRPNVCGNCLLIGNATTERPEYWVP